MSSIYNLTIYVKHFGKLEFELSLAQILGFINDLNEKKVIRIGPFIFNSLDFIRGEFNKVKEND